MKTYRHKFTEKLCEACVIDSPRKQYRKDASVVEGLPGQVLAIWKDGSGQEYYATEAFDAVFEEVT